MKDSSWEVIDISSNEDISGDVASSSEYFGPPQKKIMVEIDSQYVEASLQDYYEVNVFL